MPWSLRIVVGGYDDVRDVSSEGSTTCAQPLTRCTVIKECRRICVKRDVITPKSLSDALEIVCSSPDSATKASKSSSLNQSVMFNQCYVQARSKEIV